MLISDANNKVIHYQVGMDGSTNDSGTWFFSQLKDAMDRNALNLPSVPDGQLQDHLIGDGAYPLGERMLVPFQSVGCKSKDVYNYRISRARRIVESTFRLISARFKIFYTKMHLLPKNAEIIISAGISLHNFLLATESPTSQSLEISEPSIKLNRVEGNFPSKAHRQREALCKFFLEEGRVSWQDEKVSSTSKRKR